MYIAYNFAGIPSCGKNVTKGLLSYAYLHILFMLTSLGFFFFSFELKLGSGGYFIPSPLF